jgi:hypothetical protein
VLEDDRDVDLAAREPRNAAPRSTSTSSITARPGRTARMAVLEHDGELGRQEHERGEERSEPRVPDAQAGDLGHLGLRERHAVEDRRAVVEQHPPGLGGVHAVLRAPDELRAEPALEQRDLP